MKRPFIYEIGVTFLFLLIAILLLNPFDFFMPDRLLYVITGILVLLFGIYLGLVMRETPQDERERLHQLKANRHAYVIGLVVIVSGIAFQGIMDYDIEPWLLIALIAMVVSKLLSHIHNDRTN